MMKMDNQRMKTYTWEEYFMMMLFLSTSGTMYYFYYFSPGVAYMVFFLFVLLRFIYYKNRMKYVGSYPIVFAVIVFLNITIFNTDTIDRNGIGTILAAIASYFFFLSFDFYRFRALYLKVLSIITACSIIVYFLSEVGWIHFQTIIIGGRSEMMWYIFHLGWNYPFHRMASLWHEPGACMIFLNIAFLLYLSDIRQHTLHKSDAIRLGIIALGILCTQSTTGYIAFVLILVYCFLRRKDFFSCKGIVLLALLVLFFAIIYNSDVIQSKFAQDEEGVTSKGIRLRDNLACLQMAIEHPFTGCGFGTKTFARYSNMLDNATSSNGILRTAACVGIYFIPLYLIFAFYSIRRWNKSFIQSLVILVIFTILESNEAYMELPISYIFLARYRNMI